MGCLYSAKIFNEKEDFHKIGISSADDESTLQRIRFSYIEEVGYQVQLKCLILTSDNENQDIEDRFLELKRETILNHFLSISFGGVGECMTNDFFELIINDTPLLYKPILLMYRIGDTTENYTEWFGVPYPLRIYSCLPAKEPPGVIAWLR